MQAGRSRVLFSLDMSDAERLPCYQRQMAGKILIAWTRKRAGTAGISPDWWRAPFTHITP